MKANHNLEKELNEYLDGEKVWQTGAFFINGDWGSGKTHFIKKYINERKDNFNIVYISLNGLKNIDNINEKILSELHPWLKKYNDSITGSILNEFALKGLQKVGLNKKALSKINNAITQVPKLIVFDDLERCEIDIGELFAYFNMIMEDYGIKLIIIGAENQMTAHIIDEDKNINKLISSIIISGKLEEQKGKEENIQFDQYKNKLDILSEKISERPYYELIKEKTILCSYSFEMDKNIIFDTSFAPNINKRAFKYIKNISNDLSKLISKSGYYNLRCYNIALKNFDKIYSTIKKNNFKNIDKIMSCLIMSIFAYSIENNYKKFNVDDNTLSTINQDLVLCKSVKDYVFYTLLNKSKIENELITIDNTFKDKEDNNYPDFLKKLNNYWIFQEDKDITSGIIELYDSLKGKTFPVKYIHLAYIYLYEYKYIYKFNRECDFQYDKNDIQNIILDNIEANKKDVKEIHSDLLFIEHYETELQPFLRVIKAKLLDIIKENNSIDQRNEILNIDDSLSHEKFEEIEKNSIDRKAFLSIFSNQELIDFIRTKSQKEIESLRETIRRIYDFSNLSEFYASDKERIDCFITDLKDYLKNCDSKAKSKLIEWLINDLSNISNRL